MYRYVCILYIHYVYALQVRMSTNGIVILYIGCGRQSPNPYEIHYFKWEFYVQCVQFRFAQLFQECIPGTKWNLPVLQYPCVVLTYNRLKLYTTEIKVNCIQTSEIDIFTSRLLKGKSCVPSSCVPVNGHSVPCTDILEF